MGKPKKKGRNSQQPARMTLQEFQRREGIPHSMSFPDMMNPSVQNVQQQLEKLKVKRSTSEYSLDLGLQTTLNSDTDSSELSVASPGSSINGSRTSHSTPPLALCCGYRLTPSHFGSRHLYLCNIYVRLSKYSRDISIQTLVSRVTFSFKDSSNIPLRITSEPFEVNHPMTVGTYCEVTIEFTDLASISKFPIQYKIDTHGVQNKEAEYKLNIDTECVQAMIIRENGDAMDESNCSDWSINEVVRWAALEGLGRYAENFRQSQINGQKLIDNVSNEVAISDLRVKSELDRGRLMSGISRLKYSSLSRRNSENFDISVMANSPRIGEPPSSPDRQVRTDWRIDFKDIDLQTPLGAGSYGRVYKGTWGKTEVAIKHFFPEIQDSENSTGGEQLEQEVYILQQLRHPSICDYYGVCYHEGQIYMVMKLYPISLYRFLRMRKKTSTYLEPSKILEIALDIGEGMDYLHTRSSSGFGPIIHRDLKSPNILLEKEGNRYRARICDFGLATIKRSLKVHTDKGRGTVAWCAPEILSCGEYDESCDIWSFGVCLWEMASLKEPYEGIDAIKIAVGLSTKGNFALSFLNREWCHLGDKFPDEARIVEDKLYQVITKCLSYCSSERPSFRDIAQDLSSSLDSYIASVERKRKDDKEN